MFHEDTLRNAESKSKIGRVADADFGGHWQNQMSSTMELKISGSDVTGVYTSAASAKGGPLAGKLKGFISGDLISFLVLWPGGSMTAWVGQLVDDQAKPRIKTLWHLVTEIPNEDEDEFLWASVFSGADEFTR
jgi:hypothetical protein